MKMSRLPLNHIDFQDEAYLLQPIPSHEPPQRLVASIKRVGILHPPLVDAAERGRYRIITGRNRLLAAHKLHFTSCDCHVLPAGSSPLETFALLLEEKIASAPPTVVEQAIFFKKISPWIDLDQAARRFLPLLGLEAHPSQAKKLLRLNNLEEVIQQTLHQGGLDPKVALELEKLSFADRMALFEIIMALRLSVGNQRKLTLISREVAVRNQTTIAAFLGGDQSQEILNNTALNPPQKTAHFMNWLQKEQFPRLSQAEQEFKDFCKSLHLPPGASIQHSPSFEKDEISLTLTFKNQEELLNNLPQLTTPAGNGEEAVRE